MSECSICGKEDADHLLEGRRYCDECFEKELHSTDYLFESFPQTLSESDTSQNQSVTDVSSAVDSSLQKDHALLFRQFDPISDLKELALQLQVEQMPPAFEVEVTQQVDALPDDESETIDYETYLEPEVRELLFKQFTPLDQDEHPSPEMETSETIPTIGDRLIIEDDEAILENEVPVPEHELPSIEAELASLEDERDSMGDELLGPEDEFGSLEADLPSLEDRLPSLEEEFLRDEEELLRPIDEASTPEHKLPSIEDDLPDFSDDALIEKEELLGQENEYPSSEEQILDTKEEFLSSEDMLPGTVNYQQRVEMRSDPEPQILREFVETPLPEGVLQEVPEELGTDQAPITSEVESGSILEDLFFEPSKDTLPDEAVFLFFSGRDGLYAVNARSGKLEWKLETESPVTSTPATGYGKVFFGCRDGRLYAVDIETQKERWTLSTGDLFWPRFAIADYLICFGSSDGHFYAVDVDTGVINWKFQTNGKCQSAPEIEGGIVYFGSEDGLVYALDIRTGWEIWSFDKEDNKCVSVSLAGVADRFSSLAESLLEEAGGDVDKALHVACQDGHADAVRVLVPRVSNINIKDKLGYTALMKAAAFGHLDVVKVLLQHGANVNAGGLFGETPLNAADEGGHTEIVELLKARGAK